MRGDLPAQLTFELGVGRDLYACHSNEAVLAKLLLVMSLSFTVGSRDENHEVNELGNSYQTCRRCQRP